MGTGVVLMLAINTVTGPVEPTELGFTLMHEHVLICDWSMRMNFPRWLDRDEQLEVAVDKLSELKRRGVDTIVDPTPIDLGRDVEFIQEASLRSGLRIICATGFYHSPPIGLRWYSSQDLAKMMIGDIESGAAGGKVRCGVIKLATDEAGFTPANSKIFRAGAKAHLSTGVSIVTHSHAASRGGLAQQDVLESEGVNLSRVVIGHSGDTTDIEYLERLIERGSYIGMDRFGLDNILSFEERVRVVAEMCKRGYSQRMVISHDAACFIDWFPGGAESFAPRWQFAHIFDDVLPALESHGVSQDDIRRITVENPRAILTRGQ